MQQEKNSTPVSLQSPFASRMMSNSSLMLNDWVVYCVSKNCGFREKYDIG